MAKKQKGVNLTPQKMQWKIVGSFSTHAEAVAFRDSLEDQDKPVKIHLQGKGKTVFTVKTGTPLKKVKEEV